jgi:hypothetical protein
VASGSPVAGDVVAWSARTSQPRGGKGGVRLDVAGESIAFVARGLGVTRFKIEAGRGSLYYYLVD